MMVAQKVIKKIPCIALFLVFCFLSAEGLRVLPVMNFHHTPTSSDSFINIMMPLLQKNGVIFVDDEPDLVLICGGASESLCKKFSTFPVVILDEEEYASLSSGARKCLKKTNVRAVFKNTILRPLEKYNQCFVRNRYHFRVINDMCKFFAVERGGYLTRRELGKIQCLLWDAFRSFLRIDLETKKNEIINFDEDRSVDVFFAGSTDRRDIVGWHRQQVVDQTRKIQDRKVITYEGRLPIDEYFAFLKSSKIAVSPWGNGEWCWRDYEAILSGAVLIKPDTSFVQSVPDLYKNNFYYVPCKADFSDLEEKINYVLNNYSKFTAMRKRARKLLVDNWDYERHAKKLAYALKKVFDEFSRLKK